jgi:hypothetical protein
VRIILQGQCGNTADGRWDELSIAHLYYRERKELINPQLRALKKKKKITKPTAFACAPKTNQIIESGVRPLQSRRQLGARPVQSIRVFCARAHFYQSGPLVRAPFNQIGNMQHPPLSS